MTFEERIHPARLSGYEAALPASVAAYDEWIEGHNEYLQGAVFVDLPETFLAVNADARLPAAVVSDLGSDQVLVRVESLDYALTHTKVRSVTEMEELIELYAGRRKDDRVTPGDAKALLEEVCRSLNTNPFAVRPRFAAFAQELHTDIEATDWAERLRDRLGLAHLPPDRTTGPHPVVLMHYTVGEVAERARRLAAAHELAVPTQLDAEPYEIFHPAPRGENYGRTLNLGGPGGECDRLASEVLHLRIDYAPSHIWKVGTIVTRPGISPERLAKLRSDHLFCLRYLSGRDDFGKL